MSRPKANDRKEVVARAMERFWAHGYFATSIDDLVQATETSRHGLYAKFGNKHGLFVASLHAYSEIIVTPALYPPKVFGRRRDQSRTRTFCTAMLVNSSTALRGGCRNK